MRGAPSRWSSLAVALALLAACGHDSKQGAPSSGSVATPTSSVPHTVTAPPTSTLAPTTTLTPTSTSTTTTLETTTTVPAPPTTAPTTVAPSTLPAELPTPAAVPADSRGVEAVVDLGQIDIPKIGLSTRMYEGIRLTTLDRGPGHWPGTALPGQYGNVVVAGHRVSHAKPFRHLEQLAPGDQVIFTDSDGQFTYTVTSTEIVKPDAVWIADQTPGYTATLFACHPPGSTRERIVVHLALASA